MQLAQLQQSEPELKRLGYGVAALSYDQRVILDDFAKRKHLDLPLLSDPQSSWLRSVGLLNTEASGMIAGTAKPATLVVDRAGLVTRVIQEDAYQNRWTPASVASLLAGPQPKRLSRPVREVVWSQAQSDREVTEGNVFTVSFEIALPKDDHVYGPKPQEGLQPLSVRFADSDFFEVLDVSFPPTVQTNLMGESYAVYQGSVTVTARIKLRSSKELRKRLPELSQNPLKATVGYQVCTKAVCFPPATKTLEWKLDFRPLDLERSPETIQHHIQALSFFELRGYSGEERIDVQHQVEELSRGCAKPANRNPAWK